MMKLKRDIERERQNLHELVIRYGLCDPRVLEQSVILDVYINEYNRVKKRERERNEASA
ncbi:hypothetical protein J2T13_003406 [Paenibacillus sp. DS2015]|uniref:Spo0E family sporulation regulatory protein-aspartic acid phosphatase n=1 Tax=Paenibacillus sp. DS2015 TaxID=3373917 RepID=UPI003D1DB772